jgi:hypothetical protein
MARGKSAIFVAVLAAALGFGTASVKADNSDECSGTPFDAMMRLPSPISKWGHIACTPFGHVLESRDGWVWASVDSGSKVLIPSQVSARNPQKVGNESYFTAITATQLATDDASAAVSAFNDGLAFDEPSSKVYRVEVISVSGAINTLYFFDFGSFGGGMACPGNECDPDTRFLIIERLSKPRPPGI